MFAHGVLDGNNDFRVDGDFYVTDKIFSVDKTGMKYCRDAHRVVPVIMDNVGGYWIDTNFVNWVDVDEIMSMENALYDVHDDGGRRIMRAAGRYDAVMHCKRHAGSFVVMTMPHTFVRVWTCNNDVYVDGHFTVCKNMSSVVAVNMMYCNDVRHDVPVVIDDNGVHWLDVKYLDVDAEKILDMDKIWYDIFDDDGECITIYGLDPMGRYAAYMYCKRHHGHTWAPERPKYQHDIYDIKSETQTDCILSLHDDICDDIPGWRRHPRLPNVFGDGDSWYIVDTYMS